MSQKQCNVGPRLLLITNRKSYTRFRLVLKSRPWMTLSGHYTLLYKRCFTGPTTKIWIKIRPYCEQQKCSAVTLVSGNIRLTRIFARVWRKHQRTVGLSIREIFSAFAGYIFGTFRGERRWVRALTHTVLWRAYWRSLSFFALCV